MKVYESWQEMVEGHQVLTYGEILALKEPSLNEFLEVEESFEDVEEEDEVANIFACMKSGRLLVDILEKHKLHVITLSIFDTDKEDDDGHELSCYSYSTGFHAVNREKYYLCRKDTEATFEEEV